MARPRSARSTGTRCPLEEDLDGVGNPIVRALEVQDAASMNSRIHRVVMEVLEAGGDLAREGQ